jgi:hypothetical protein
LAWLRAEPVVYCLHTFQQLARAARRTRRYPDPPISTVARAISCQLRLPSPSSDQGCSLLLTTHGKGTSQNLVQVQFCLDLKVPLTFCTQTLPYKMRITTTGLRKCGVVPLATPGVQCMEVTPVIAQRNSIAHALLPLSFPPPRTVLSCSWPSSPLALQVPSLTLVIAATLPHAQMAPTCVCGGL